MADDFFDDQVDADIVGEDLSQAGITRGYLIALSGFLPWIVVPVALAMATSLGFPSNDRAWAIFRFVLIFASLLWKLYAFISGCLLVATGKGYSELLGFFCGLFSPLGIVVLALLPRRTAVILNRLRERKQSADPGASSSWELTRLQRRVDLLRQLFNTTGPSVAAQQKLSKTGKTAEQYRDQTVEAIKTFVAKTKDENERTIARDLKDTTMSL